MGEQEQRASTEVATRQPQTQEDWLSQQTGVSMFRTETGHMALSFNPEFASRFNFLAPVSQVLQLDASWRPVPKVIQLDPEVDFYSRKGKLQLSKQGLNKLAQLAQIEKDGAPQVDYMQGAGIAITVFARQRNIDGTWRKTSGSKTVWFARQEAKIRRDNASKSEEYIEKLIDEFYDQIAQKVETMAWLRCVRELLGVPNEFTNQTARKPFFVMGVAFVPDWSNPQIGRLLDLQFGQGIKDLYGEPPEGARQVASGAQAQVREIEPPDGSMDADVDGFDDDEPYGSDPGPEAASPEEWDEPEGGVQAPPLPEIPKPTDGGFVPKGGPFQGKNVEEWASTEEGKKWLAAAIYRMRSDDKKAQGLAWLSWAEQKQVTFADLEARAQAQAA